MPVIDLAQVDLRALTPDQLDWRKFVLPVDHPMRVIRIEKVVANIGVGQSGERLEKAAKVLEELTQQEPSYRLAKRSIKDWNIRKGEPIGVAVTLRRNKAVWFLLRTLAAVDFTLRENSFDDWGNVAFGIREHIMIPGTKYDPSVGVWGLNVVTVLARPGLRVMYRRRARYDVGKEQRVSKAEAMKFFQEVLGVKIIK
ncbi:50S ribosomal protein L5 [Vulcanisaeta moutnovskia 768-28]|uniref:Large ribosomal subunit protein uL5 n=1 Tax=Vulcanisaeta moutnovskia (strain 768-28) TaxID=985053 RepID=F0QSN6_VULM7|nr:50S ribosomal protein L5 [Vulcanisaeta moutnovskia]ADY01553.1 50S ribosomal protein L5 [Vulcanisaeta moutnovskia 768-28]